MRSCAGVGDLLPVGIHTPALPNALVALRGLVSSVFVTPGNIPTDSRTRTEWREENVRAGYGALSLPLTPGLLPLWGHTRTKHVHRVTANVPLFRDSNVYGHTLVTSDYISSQYNASTRSQGTGRKHKTPTPVKLNLLWKSTSTLRNDLFCHWHHQPRPFLFSIQAVRLLRYLSRLFFGHWMLLSMYQITFREFFKVCLLVKPLHFDLWITKA